MKPNKPIQKLVNVSTMAFSIASSGLIAAAEFSVTPKVGLSSEFNDNRQMVLDSIDHDSVLGGILELSADMAVATEASAARFTPRARFTRYTDYEVTFQNTNQPTSVDLGTEEVYIDYSASHTIERATFGFTGNFTRDTTLTSELVTLRDADGNILDNQGDNSPTGITQVQLQRISYDINPYLSYALTERQLLRAGASYRDISYADNSAGLQDYTYKSANLSDIFQYDEKNQITATIFVSELSSQRKPQTLQNGCLFGLIDCVLTGSSVTENIGFKIDYNHRFDETFDVGAGVGHIFSDTQSETLFNDLRGREIFKDNQDASSSGFLFSAEATKKFERTQLHGEFNRSVNPSGTGTQNAQDDISFSINHQISPRLDANLGFQYLITSQQATGNQNISYTYWSLNNGINYRLTPFWTLGASYRYAASDNGVSSGSGTTDGSASSNAVLLSIGYDGQKRAISR